MSDSTKDIIALFEVCQACRRCFVPNKETKKCCSCKVYFCKMCSNKVGTCLRCKKHSLESVEDEKSRLKNDEIWKDNVKKEVDYTAKMFHLLRTTINSNQETIEALKKTNQSLTKENEELKNDVKELQNKTTTNEASIEALIEKNKEFVEENDKLKNNVKLLHGGSVADGVSIQFLQDETSGFIKEVENLKNEVCELKGEIVGVLTECKELKDQMQQLQDEMKIIKIVDAEKASGVCETELFDFDAVQQECGGMQENFNALDKMIGDFQAGQGVVREEFEKLLGQSKDFLALENKIKQIEDKIDGFVNGMESQSVRDMTQKIQKLGDEQKKSIDLMRDLQQKNTRGSRILQSRINLIEHKFNDAVEHKTYSNCNNVDRNVSFCSFCEFLIN